MRLNHLLIGASLWSVNNMVSAGLAEAPPLGLGAPSLGLLNGPTLGGPLAIPALAIVGGVALISGIRRIKLRRKQADD